MRLGLVDNLIMAGLATNKNKCAVVLLDSKSKFAVSLYTPSVTVVIRSRLTARTTRTLTNTNNQITM